jgi:transposase
MRRVVMEAIYQSVAGLDVHTQTVVACRRRLIAEGQVESEVSTFGTTSRQLRELAQWLKDWGVTHVAMESTGIYWQPVWNILEGQFNLLLANAQHLKKVPGRKSDCTDAEWIAQLMQCGLLRASFVPPEHVRQWRELSRQRTKLLDQQAAVINRLHKVLESANLKLGSVVSNIMGVSGRLMLKQMIAGESDAARLAALARGTLKKKEAELTESLEGRFSEHQRWMLERLMKQLEFLEEEISIFDAKIGELMRPFARELELLDTIDGVGIRNAECLLAELGTDMNQFPSEQDLASWSGMCPGRNESAGKQKSGKIPKGNKWLKRVLVEAAWSAVKVRNSYLAAQYRRLAARRGKKRAIVAVGHTILVAAYHILQEGVPYHDLGGDYFDRLITEKSKAQMVKKLERMGYKVELTPLQEAA